MKRSTWLPLQASRLFRIPVVGAGDRTILANAGSLTGAMAINAALGFAYWWLAARLFAPAAVGLASAAVSAMMLLGNAGMLGLGTLLLGEIPRRPGHEGELITMGLASSALAGAVLGVTLALVSPWVAGELGVLAESAGSVILFSLGVSLTAATLVLDQALVGLSRGIAQLRRNVIFAASKLVLLYLVGIWARDGSGLMIFATWVAGILLSLVMVARVLPRARLGVSNPARFSTVIRRLGRSALTHHSLNIVLQAPSLMLPLIVTVVLSAEVNAGFYIAWMVVSMVFVGPDSLAIVLYTASAANPAELPRRLVRLGLLSLVWGGAANAALWLLAGPMLALFGPSYAKTATTSLHILALAVFPLVIRFLYIAVRRIEGHVGSTAALMAAGGLLELAAATAGAHRGGLPGLCTGWLLALCLQAVFLAPAVRRAMREGARIAGNPPRD